MIKVALNFYLDRVNVDVTYDDGALSVTASECSIQDPSPADVKEVSDRLTKEVTALVAIHKGAA